MESLKEKLQARNIFSNLTNQFLVYDIPEGLIKLALDEDIQNAVFEA